MKFATLKSQSPDGTLVMLSRDLSTAVSIADIAPTLQYALENWTQCQALFQECYDALNAGRRKDALSLESVQFDAPLPRSWQWLDGSCFLNHGHLMQKAFHLDPIEDADKYPLMYQGAGDNFSGPEDDIVVADATHGADFEGEFAVITGDVEMGATPAEAAQAIRLVVMLNDISYRGLAPREMKTGFGFVQAKGATAFAPIAVTPDELGEHWRDNRAHLTMQITRNGVPFGHPHGREMHFGFDQLIAHAALTRTLQAGTVIGSGTVSNKDPDVGQACISELRAKELIAHGAPQTSFLQHGEVVALKATDNSGSSVFGEICQYVKVENKHV
ncbi:MAG: fumarylacetoacetate hydrolase family protein [Alteromonadaceae bacterium]|nr:fumarylacetoacetate hydrolase family protein [Alteromonadaceae bacterium]